MLVLCTCREVLELEARRTPSPTPSHILQYPNGLHEHARNSSSAACVSVLLSRVIASILVLMLVVDWYSDAKYIAALQIAIGWKFDSHSRASKLLLRRRRCVVEHHF